MVRETMVVHAARKQCKQAHECPPCNRPQHLALTSVGAALLRHGKLKGELQPHGWRVARLLESASSVKRKSTAADGGDARSALRGGQVEEVEAGRLHGRGSGGGRGCDEVRVRVKRRARAEACVRDGAGEAERRTGTAPVEALSDEQDTVCRRRRTVGDRAVELLCLLEAPSFVHGQCQLVPAGNHEDPMWLSILEGEAESQTLLRCCPGNPVEHDNRVGNATRIQRPVPGQQRTG